MKKKAKKKKAGDKLQGNPMRPKAKIIRDPRTGLFVLRAGKDVPTLTSEQVREALADFP